MNKDKVYTNWNLSDALATVRRLCTQGYVTLDEVPAPLRQDLQTFMVGKTMTTVGGKDLIHKADFYFWYNKIFYTTGLDYQVEWDCMDAGDDQAEN
jgi:hypothetical protein